MAPVSKLSTVESVANHIADARRLIRGKNITIGRWVKTKEKEGKKPAEWEPAESWKAYTDSPKAPASSAGTLGNYETYWKHFTVWLAKNRPEIVTVSQIDADIADAYCTALWKNAISARTFNAYIMGLKLVCRILEAGLKGNPFEGITPKKETRQAREALTKDKAWEILCKLANPELAIPNRRETRVLWIIGLTCGFRLADAVLLKWKAVDFKHGVIRIVPAKTINRRPKSKKGKPPDATPPITPLLSDALIEAVEWEDESGYVLPTLAKSFLKNRNAVDRNVCRVLDSVGLGKKNEGNRGIDRRLYGFHSCRHFFCTECAQAGIPLSALAAMVGDQMTTLEDYYVHDSEKSHGETVAALALSPEDRERSLLINEVSDKLRELPIERLRQIAETVSPGERKMLE
jgi:integrase